MWDRDALYYVVRDLAPHSHAIAAIHLGQGHWTVGITVLSLFLVRAGAALAQTGARTNSIIVADYDLRCEPISQIAYPAATTLQVLEANGLFLVDFRMISPLVPG
mgnify:FL=1